MRPVKNNTRGKAFVIIAVLFLVAYFLYKLIQIASGGLTLMGQDRVSIVFFGSQVRVLSFGVTDGVHYVIELSNEQRVIVPGGYGRYKVGSMQKLAELEEDPGIMQRATSSVLSAYVDRYFAPQKAGIYTQNSARGDFSKLALLRRVFSVSSITNATIADRIYIGYLIIRTNKNSFVELSTNTAKQVNGDAIFSERGYLKKYRGFFFHKTYREESLDTKILYNNYDSAVDLSRVIEGQGIRIVDLDKAPQSFASCIITLDKDISGGPRATISFFKREFDCSVEDGTSEGADITVILGSELEEKWE